MNATQRLQKLLPAHYRNILPKFDDITEVRMRVGKPLSVAFGSERQRLAHTVCESELDYTVGIASHNSVYAVQDAILHGYLSYDGGIRIGLGGEGITEKGRLVSIKNITSLVIRVPHAVAKMPPKLANLLKPFENTLIVAPPGAGKTTLLREMVRRLADGGRNVLVIDERNEISASVMRAPSLELGACSDVLVNIPKLDCYENIIRTLSPDIIATDEIFGRAEAEALADCVRAGVKVLATVHGDDIDCVFGRAEYSGLKSVVKNCVLLSASPTVGTVAEVRKL